MTELVKHQQQPCPFSCVSTCIAMIVGVPAAEVVERFHQPYREGSVTTRQMLDAYAVRFDTFDSLDGGSLTSEGVYFCCAPSLNIVGGNHQILVEVTDDDYFVHDPVQGREDRFYYVKRGQNGSKWEVELGGFIVEAFIPREWFLK